MNQQEIDQYEPQLPEFLFYPKEHGESLVLNIVNPDTATEFDVRFEKQIMEYLKQLKLECCLCKDFKNQLEKSNETIDSTKGNLFRYNELIRFLLSFTPADCNQSILVRHQEFVDGLIEENTDSDGHSYPNVALIHQLTNEERKAAWKIHTTIVISKIIFSACAEYRAEYKKWKEAQVDELTWDLYKLSH